jgi:Leucine-rich repeat (LRR) protein
VVFLLTTILILPACACGTTPPTTTITVTQTVTITPPPETVTPTPTPTPTPTLAPVTFPDAYLEIAIREAIGKPVGPISTPDLESLTVLDASGRGINDISVLAGLINLQELYLWDNKISDISALAIFNLQKLYLWDNNISDISPLAGLSNLQELYLWDNKISDISALAGLSRLQELHLYNNNISDISSLVENSGLSAGDTVNLGGNPLNTTSLNDYIPQLRARGVNVEK